ncbi:MAG: hypothetical protein BGO70_10990 [Bacteroidetes bacterium 43-93]|nr:MAG: hypothetical protein BGO70_10990 [Bacteroidetes bacterium 43-93]
MLGFRLKLIILILFNSAVLMIADAQYSYYTQHVSFFKETSVLGKKFHTQHFHTDRHVKTTKPRIKSLDNNDTQGSLVTEYRKGYIILHTTEVKNYTYVTRFFSHKCCVQTLRGPPVVA